MRYCGHFLNKAEGGAKNYERDHPLPLAWRPFSVVFLQRKGYLASERSERDTHRGNAIEISLYLASERSERDTLSRSSMKNAIRIYIYIY